jgi:hypothetical protein
MRVLRGIQNPVSMRKILAFQLKKFNQSGCPLYAIHVLNAAANNDLMIEDHPVLWEFKYLFPEEVPRLPPKQDLDFSIYLAAREVSTS